MVSMIFRTPYTTGTLGILTLSPRSLTVVFLLSLLKDYYFYYCYYFLS